MMLESYDDKSPERMMEGERIVVYNLELNLRVVIHILSSLLKQKISNYGNLDRRLIGH